MDIGSALFGAVVTVAAIGVGGLSLLAGSAIKARENLGRVADAITGLPAGARQAALEDRIGEMDTSELAEVRDAIVHA